MNYLVYLVYGGEDYNNEALYSLLSYYNHHTGNENQVVIYTDNVDFFKRYLPINTIYHELQKQTITEWKGDINFIHRVKIKMLQDVAEKYSGNILYLDTDTFFTKNTSDLFGEIAKGTVVLDKLEGPLKDNPGGIAKKMRTFLKNQQSFIIPSFSGAIILTDNFTVYNAGIIGFNSGFSDKLQQILELTDVLYSGYRLFVMEQIAVNYFAQQHSPPKTAENYIHHYWYFKEFRAVLKHFFDHNKSKSFTELQKEISRIDPVYLSSEKRAYKKLSFWQRTFRKITKGKRWEIPEYKL
ncbi:MAG: hypothetical protein ACO1N9_01840 [Flavobacterium sp.]